DEKFGAGSGGGPGLPDLLSTGVGGRSPNPHDIGNTFHKVEQESLRVLDTWRALDGVIKKTHAHLDDFHQAIEDIRQRAAEDVGGFMVDAFVALAFEG